MDILTTPIEFIFDLRQLNGLSAVVEITNCNLIQKAILTNDIKEENKIYIEDVDQIKSLLELDVESCGQFKVKKNVWRLGKITSGFEMKANCSTRSNWHVHPRISYRKGDIKLNWASAVDIENMIRFRTQIEFIFTLEGIYSYQFNPKLKNFKRVAKEMACQDLIDTTATASDLSQVIAKYLCRVNHLQQQKQRVAIVNFLSWANFSGFWLIY